MTKIKPAILACDPSLTAWGWAVLRGNCVVETGCIKTEPLAKKRKIREGDDRARRTKEIIYSLGKTVDNHGVEFIVSELPHGSQNAKAAIMLGMVVGILETLVYYCDIPLEWYSEDDAKKAVVGRKSASKAEIIAGVDQLYEVNWRNVKYIDEAVADSLAIYYAAECHSPTIKYMTR